MNDLKDKIAIVTGGARGIGRGIALAMAREGAMIVIADIDDSTFVDIQEDFSEFGGKCVYNYLDVRDYDSMSNLVESVVSRFGQIDILVNNAGVNAGKSLLDLSREEVLRVFETNLIGPFFLTQAVVGVMIEKKITGNILFTSSTHSQVTMLRPAYSSSKAAIEMFVKDAALELAEYGIRVNAVAPGAIDIWNMDDRSSEQVPAGYLGTPADIGNVMVFLASEKSGYITGQTIVVDGAFSLAHMHFWKQKGKL